MPSTKILSNHGRDREGQCYHWKEKSLHHACSYPKAGLGSGTEISNDAVNHQDINEEESKFCPGRNPNVQHSVPDLHLGAEQRETKFEIVKFLFEVNDH